MIFDVLLLKDARGYGLQIGKGDSTFRVVGFRAHGVPGPAERSGLIQRKDILVEINHTPVSSLSNILNVLDSSDTSTVFRFARMSESEWQEKNIRLSAENPSLAPSSPAPSTNDTYNRNCREDECMDERVRSQLYIEQLEMTILALKAEKEEYRQMEQQTSERNCESQVDPVVKKSLWNSKSSPTTEQLVLQQALFECKRDTMREMKAQHELEIQMLRKNHVNDLQRHRGQMERTIANIQKEVQTDNVSMTYLTALRDHVQQQNEKTCRCDLCQCALDLHAVLLELCPDMMIQRSTVP